jgi:hypothetical protein
MVDFRGEKRSNATHQSSTDPEAKLMRKGNGQPAKLSFGAHALRENRSGRSRLVALEERGKTTLHKVFFNGLLGVTIVSISAPVLGCKPPHHTYTIEKILHTIEIWSKRVAESQITINNIKITNKNNNK